MCPGRGPSGDHRDPVKILTRVLTTLAVGVLSGAALLGIEVAVARSGVRPEVGPANPSDAPAGPPGTAVDAVVWLGDSTASGVGVTTAGASLPEQVAGLIGKPVRLTVTEFLILQALAQRPGFVKSRDSLMDAAYDDQVYVDDRTIDSHIKRLRKKFKAVADDFDAIETLYGVGYRYRE